MRARTTATILLAASAALPVAPAAAQRTKYSVVKARGSERMTFEGDPATCATYGTCGDSGRIAYTFGGTPRGSLVLDRNRRGRMKGTARFHSRGKTVAEVTSSVSGPCRDTVNRGRERFALASSRSLRRLRFTLHQRPGSDFLKTDCLSPSEVALARSKALPRGSFKTKDFRGVRTSFRLTGNAGFTYKGYRGQVKWSLSYRVARRGG